MKLTTVGNKEEREEEPDTYSLVGENPTSHQRCVRSPEYDPKLLNFFVVTLNEELKN